MTKLEKILEVATNDDLMEMVSECNSWNDSLYWLEVYDNDEHTINEILPNAYEALRSVYFGNYNYNDDYIRFNAYGNIKSIDKYDYMKELEDNASEIIDNFINLYELNHVSHSNSDITDILDEKSE